MKNLSGIDLSDALMFDIEIYFYNIYGVKVISIDKFQINQGLEVVVTGSRKSITNQYFSNISGSDFDLITNNDMRITLEIKNIMLDIVKNK